MRVAVLFSGGKDSVYAAYLCLSWGWEVILVTLNPEPDSMMFHHPNTKFCKFQAEAAGLKFIEVDVKHETELEDLKKALSKLKINGIVTGAIASEYQKQRIEMIGHELDLPTFNPLWHKGFDFLYEMLEQMEVYFVSVSAEGLDKSYLGQRFRVEDAKAFEKSKSRINPFLEGGEGETFVCDAPFFKKKIVVDSWDISFSGTCGKALIKSARLKKK
jgi:diphthine-ammonia ligase